ncbi:MAG: tail fiber domain-containing protein, partial [Elusimicrobiota bacterium]
LGASAWVYGSDRRLKENISYIQSGLSVIEQLKPVKFDYINGDKKQVGFIAQEVQEILPDIVTEGANGMLGMKTDSIIPYLVKAMKELKLENEGLKTRIFKLENK